ncbi:MAG TPA: HEAT repeat domain-containing protein [Pirellulales bacterium]
MLVRIGCLSLYAGLLAAVGMSVNPRPSAAVVKPRPTAEAAIVANLVAVMNSGDRAERSAAVAELGRFDALLLKDLETPALREHALRVLIEVGLEAQIPIAMLGNITASGSLDARRRAWDVLSRKDMFGPISRAAFAQLAQDPSEKSLQALDAALASDDLRRAALQASRIANPSSIILLNRLSLNRNRNANLRLMASDLLADRAKKVESIPELIKLLESADTSTREIATHALGDFGAKAKSAVPALTRHLADESELVRLYSTYALASIGPAAREAVPALQQAVKSHDPAVRSAAIHALAKIAPVASRE